MSTTWLLRKYIAGWFHYLFEHYAWERRSGDSCHIFKLCNYDISHVNKPKQIPQPAKAAFRQVQLQSTETCTSDLLQCKQSSDSHQYSKAENVLVEVFYQWQ